MTHKRWSHNKEQVGPVMLMQTSPHTNDRQMPARVYLPCKGCAVHSSNCRCMKENALTTDFMHGSVSLYADYI